MRLYLVRVEATSISDVRFGDRVVKGQKLGSDLDCLADVLAPADGVIRHIGLEEGGRVNIIHVLSREDEKVRSFSA